MDTKQFLTSIKQIAEEKGISEKSVLETIEAAIAAAYKRDYGKKGQIIKAKINPEGGPPELTQTHYVIEGVDDEEYITGPLPVKVLEDRQDSQDLERPRRDNKSKLSGDKERKTSEENSSEEGLKIKFNPEKHVLLKDAKKIKKNIKIGDELVEKLESKTDFGRIAAQTAKQVVIQRLREAEREAIFSEFKEREGEIVSGVVQRKEGPLVFIDLGKTNGLLAPTEQVMGDNYRIGQRFRLIILKVEETLRGPVVLLSRSHPKLVLELFKMEVPEIDSGTVEVKSIAREASSRTKIAVTSQEEGVDPIGSLVGQKGVRVQTVINELSGEKVDIVLWSKKPKEYIANALSPAKIIDAKVLDEDRKHALVEVSEDQFSLAIGKGGQNVRLAAKLTGWKIDVRSPKDNLDFKEVIKKDSKDEPVALKDSNKEKSGKEDSKDKEKKGKSSDKSENDEKEDDSKNIEVTEKAESEDEDRKKDKEKGKK